MTLPFFSAIRRYLKWAVLAAAVLFVLIESWLCLVGWPRFTRRILARHLAPAGGSCQIGWMRGTLLFGIELENLAIHAPSDAGQINAVIPSLAVGFNRLALLRGKIIPGHVRAHRVSASILAGQFITASGGKPRLHCNDGELNLALSANRTMKGRASFKFHGATIGGEIDLRAVAADELPEVVTVRFSAFVVPPPVVCIPPELSFVVVIVESEIFTVVPLP